MMDQVMTVLKIFQASIKCGLHQLRMKFSSKMTAPIQSGSTFWSIFMVEQPSARNVIEYWGSKVEVLGQWGITWSWNTNYKCGLVRHIPTPIYLWLIAKFCLCGLPCTLMDVLVFQTRHDTSHTVASSRLTIRYNVSRKRVHQSTWNGKYIKCQ